MSEFMGIEIQNELVTVNTLMGMEDMGQDQWDGQWDIVRKTGGDVLGMRDGKHEW